MFSIDFLTQHLRYLKRICIYLPFILLLASVGMACPSKQQIKKTKVKAEIAPKTKLLKQRYQLPMQSPFSPKRGPANAPIQVLELLNPLHPNALKMLKLRQVLWQNYPGMIRWTIRYNPQIGKDKGYYYCRALAAAKHFDRFWEYLDRLQSAPKPLSTQKLIQLAQQESIDPQKFELQLANPSLKMLVDRDSRWAFNFQANGSSRIFINGALLSPPYTKKHLLEAVEEAKNEALPLLKKGLPVHKLYSSLIKNAKPLPRLKNAPPALRFKRYIRVPHAFLEGVPIRGPGNASIQIIEFSDFTCSPCRVAYKSLHRLMLKRPKQVQLFFKYYPIGAHRQSYRAAEMAAAAQARRKFWPLYDLLFQKQDRVFRGELLALAKEAGLDPNWLAGELDRRSFLRRVKINHGHGRKLGIRGVPALIINGRAITGSPSPGLLNKIVLEELWKAGQPDPNYP